jgi:ribosomal protein S18 acetylase RimI-like enzyme
MEDPRTGELAGTSWLTWDGRRVFLHHFAIRPRLQGQGLGKILARASLDFAREKGCPVKLEVHRENKAAIHLYQSSGFNGFGDYEVFMNLNP